MDGVPTDVSRAILSRLIPPGDAVEIEFDGDAPAQFRDWLETRALLERLFTPALGFGRVTRVNLRDGLRVYFSNGDVAHLRPSGNAPQLRVYANADSQARADEIVALALREPDGLVRRAQERVIQTRGAA
jgi:phosphomannomutase